MISPSCRAYTSLKMPRTSSYPIQSSELERTCTTMIEPERRSRGQRASLLREAARRHSSNLLQQLRRLHRRRRRRFSSYVDKSLSGAIIIIRSSYPVPSPGITDTLSRNIPTNFSPSSRHRWTSFRLHHHPPSSLPLPCHPFRPCPLPPSYPPLHLLLRDCT